MIAGGEVEEQRGVYRGVNGEGWRLTWDGEHTIQCTDDVLYDCVPETGIILLTSVTPISLLINK